MSSASAAKGGAPGRSPRLPRLRPRAGFTLLEALAAVALLGIGIVATTSSFGALIRNEDRARMTEKMQGLAEAKLAELQALGTATTSANGDFTEEGEPDYTWSLEANTSGVTDLDAVKITVTHENGGETAKIDTLVYVPPQTSTTAGGTPAP
jgi:prepilin-type N-terminal cleavage/methylation domain-containing protein